MLCSHKRCRPGVAGTVQRHAMRCGRQLGKRDASALSLAVLEKSGVITAQLVSPDIFLSCKVLKLELHAVQVWRRALGTGLRARRC